MEVYSVVRIESPVFRGDNRIDKSCRYSVQWSPVQHAPSRVDSQFVQRLPVSIEKHRVRPSMPGANLVEGRRPRRGRPRAKRGDGEGRGEREKDSPRDRNSHGRTSTGALGISPNISGEYMASTRVGGRPNAPALLKRTVYSTVNSPFGTYS